MNNAGQLDLRRQGPGRLAAHGLQLGGPTTTTSGIRSPPRWAPMACSCSSTASGSASRTDTTSGEAYLGYWRVGGDNLGGWPSSPSNVNFVTATSTRSPSTRRRSRQTRSSPSTRPSGRTSPIPPHPADAYGAAVYNDEPDLYWRFGESTGTTAADPESLNDGTYRNGAAPAQNQAGALARIPTAAASFDGTQRLRVLEPPVLQARPSTPKRRGSRPPPPGRQDHRLRLQPDRHLRQLRPAHLHAEQRSAHVRRLDRLHQHHHHGRRRTTTAQWHHVVATQSRRRDEALRRRRSSSAPTRQTGPRTTPATGGSAATTTWGSSSPYFNGRSTRPRCTPPAQRQRGSRQHFAGRWRRSSTSRPRRLHLHADAAQGDVRRLGLHRPGRGGTSWPTAGTSATVARAPGRTRRSGRRAPTRVTLTVTDNRVARARSPTTSRSPAPPVSRRVRHGRHRRQPGALLALR